MESKRLDNAALAAGINPSYINAHGKPQSIAAVTKQRLLDAMHRSTAATKVAVNPLPNIENFHSRQKNVAAGGRADRYQWILTTEDGKQYQGKAQKRQTLPLPAKLPEVPLPDPHPGGSAGTAELSSRQRAAMSRSR